MHRTKAYPCRVSFFVFAGAGRTEARILTRQAYRIEQKGNLPRGDFAFSQVAFYYILEFVE
jgi:hypothetical protein